MALKITHSLIIGLLGLTVLSCRPSDQECSIYHNGRFVVELPGDDRTYVTRTDNVQIEEGPRKSFRDEYNIQWLDACTYQLSLTKTDHPELLPISKWDTLTVEMVQVFPEGKGYNYRFSFGGERHNGTALVRPEPQ